MQEDSNELLQLKALRRQRQIEVVCESERDLLGPRDAASLIASEVTVDRAGNVEPASVHAALQGLKTRAPWMWRSARPDNGNLPGIPPQRELSDSEKARHLFGPGSNSRDANALAQSSKSEYRRLRGTAERLGLI